METVYVSIKWPFKWCLVGSSGSGKTEFSLKLVINALKLFDTSPSKIIVVYKEFQDIYTKFNDHIPTSLYKEEDVDLEELTKLNKERLLIICDDLYFSKKMNEIAEQFLVKGRHRNTSWIVLTQSIFNHPALKNISRNSTHITLFKSVRLTEPHIFFSQLRPQSSKVLQDIYREATQESYLYLDIDLSQTCPDKLRYKTDIFRNIVQVFMIMKNNTFKTMYLVNKHDLNNNSNKNFSLSLQNGDVCQGGVNVSVKPIKSRLQSSTKKSKTYDNARTSQGEREEDTDSIGYTNDVHDDNSSKNKKVINGRNVPKLYTSMDSSSGQIEGGRFFPIQNHQITDDNILDDSEAIATPAPHSYETNTHEENGSPRKQYKRHLKKLSRKGDMLSKKFKYRNQATKNRYRNGTKNSHINSRKALSYIPPNDQPFQQTSNINDDTTQITQTNSNAEDDDSSSGENPVAEEKGDHNEENYTLSGNIENIGNIGNETSSTENDERKNENNEWIKGLNSRLKDRRVQFKRKQDQIGYRINPTDISRSLIKPSDFQYLDSAQSSEYLQKWRPLNEVAEGSPHKKKFKRFKPY